MAKFCGKCGSKLDEATGLCPSCDADKLNKQAEKPKAVEPPKQEQDAASETKKPLSKKEAKKQRKAEKKAAKKAKKKEKWAKLTFGQKVKKILFRLLMWIILLAVLGCALGGALSYFGFIDVPAANKIFDFVGLQRKTRGGLDEYKIDAPDAQGYYEESSEIVGITDAADSEEVLTETEAAAVLEERGFNEYPITTEYSMDGAYSDAQAISSASSDKHPIYQTYYMSSSGDFWTVFVINGAVLANPVSYNMQSSRSTSVIVSETDTVMSYDSSSNKFYETIPKKSALLVISAGKIDAQALDKLTIGEIERYD